MTEPEPTALYRIFAADGSLLYVGITNDPQIRLRQHSQDSAWWPEVSYQTVAWYETREKADDAETMAIALEGPRHNIRKQYVPVSGVPFNLKEPPPAGLGASDPLTIQVKDVITCALDRISSEPDDQKAIRQASELVRMLRSRMIDTNTLRARRACQHADRHGVPIGVMSEMLGMSKAGAAQVIHAGRNSARRVDRRVQPTLTPSPAGAAGDGLSRGVSVAASAPAGPPGRSGTSRAPSPTVRTPDHAAAGRPS